MKVCLRVAGREIGPGQPPYRIADAASDHGGDVQLGYKLIETARADAIVFDAPRPGGPLSERDFKSLLGQAQYVGLTAFGTAFDLAQVAFLSSLEVPAFVLAGAGADALLGPAAATGKPLFVRDGVAHRSTDAASGAVVLHPQDSSSLIEADGHVIMTRHTLEAVRMRAASDAVRKGKQRA